MTMLLRGTPHPGVATDLAERHTESAGTRTLTRPAIASKEEVGRRLRALRKSSKLTLKMLSEASGIPLSTISKMELGQIAVSYEKFSAIAHALNVDPSSLFDGSSASTEARPTVVKSSAASTAEYRSETYIHRMLAGDFPHKKMTPMQAQLLARDRSEFADFIRHPGEEFVMVLSGTVRIEFETGESITLKRHESAYFNSSIGHIYLSVGRGNAEVVAVCTDK
ncbi:MAG TPA: XRE family transcriptional regulator [Noviherbaspirillum sp.]|nr:XRE family transcriptional regulator [Noviherbaspirillum sp.]